MKPLRVAMLTYSVKPRGGVVHSLAVAEALAARARGQLFAVGRPGEGFFRTPAVPATVVDHVPPDAAFDERVVAMIDAYRAGWRARSRDAAIRSMSSTRRTASRLTRRSRCATPASSRTSCAPCTTSTTSRRRR